METALQPERNDTIAAIATPPGSGGIGIVRISGPRAKEVLARMFLPLSAMVENFTPWHLHRGRVIDWNGEALFGSPSGSGRGFDLLGTLVIDDGDDIWVGATTNHVFGAVTNEFRNGINITEATP